MSLPLTTCSNTMLDAPISSLGAQSKLLLTSWLMFSVSRWEYAVKSFPGTRHFAMCSCSKLTVQELPLHDAVVESRPCVSLRKYCRSQARRVHASVRHVLR